MIMTKLVIMLYIIKLVYQKNRWEEAASLWSFYKTSNVARKWVSVIVHSSKHLQIGKLWHKREKAFFIVENSNTELYGKRQQPET